MQLLRERYGLTNHYAGDRRNTCLFCGPAEDRGALQHDEHELCILLINTNTTRRNANQLPITTNDSILRGLYE